MKTKICIAVFMVILLFPSVLCAAGKNTQDAGSEKPAIRISEEIDEAVSQEASKVKEEFEDKLESLAVRDRFAWGTETITYVYEWFLSIPSKMPQVLKMAADHSEVLGVLGSMILVLFLAAILYSFFWQKRVISWVEEKTKPLAKLLSRKNYTYFVVIVDVVTSVLVPAVLIGFYALFGRLFEYETGWFTYIGRMLWLWLGAMLVSRTFRELLTNKDASSAAWSQGPTVYRWIRVIVLYSAVVLALYWLVEIFDVREDVTALLSFVVSLSITIFLLLLVLKKKAIMSVMPKLENPIYQNLHKFVRVFYYPLVLVTLSGALLWTFGYDDFGLLILQKIWITLLVVIAIVLSHHILSLLLKRWIRTIDASDDHAYKFARNLKSILLFVTILALFIAVLNLLGLFDPLQRLMSIPLMQIGDSVIRLWTIMKAIIIVTSFYFVAILLQSYMDYKVYPMLGVDHGIGFVINTTFKYLIIGMAVIIALNIIGIDLKVLLVFAGAIGIGIGLGLQSMAANIISGFTIIFGRKIRRGDWIEVDGRLGQVSDIYLRATKMKNRDDVEYLVPNANLISSTIVNYSFSSPLIRIHLPVGVSYKSDPEVVREILMNVAENDKLVSKGEKPLVRFMEYADSSLNFELLVWINVRTIPKEEAMSSLYFTIFEEFKKHGIEIPFPQRDVHVKTQPLTTGA
jgi:small-conductance mechanosensitive channel